MSLFQHQPIFVGLFALLLLQYISLCRGQQQTNVGAAFFDCAIDEYYQGFEGLSRSEWGRLELATLLRDSHRQVLPYTSSRNDVWDALIDLDATPDGQKNVNLIYRDVQVPALDYGTPDTWNREHIWPKSRGVGTSGPDYTDVHALRPSDWNVNSARSNLYFGDCEDRCTSRPATEEAAEDTAKDGDMFLPPADVRGDVARAILYMELRYSFFDETYTNVLELTDCPEDGLSYQMAYLSDLLRWHAEDPPDSEEVVRNDRVCSHWQGNRNVFVDFPDLATILHGNPAEKPYTCNGAPSPTNSPVDSTPTTVEETNSGSPLSSITPSTAVPEAVTSEGSCSKLTAGAVQIVSVSSDNPDSFALVALQGLPSGMELFVTDNAWTGQEFRSNEGITKLVVPIEGIPKGSVFGYGDSGLLHSTLWESAGSNSFALATAGDSLIVYCKEDESYGAVNHLGALIIGRWQRVDTSQLSTNESLLPKSLAQGGAIEIGGGRDNLVYIGRSVWSKRALLDALAENSNWAGSNSERFVYRGGDFKVEGDMSLFGESMDDFQDDEGSTAALSSLTLFSVFSTLFCCALMAIAG